MTNAPSRPLLSALTGSEAVETLFSNEAELAALLQVEAALSDAEAKAGLLTIDAAARIGDACRAFKPDWQNLAKGLAKDGVIVPELVRQLRGQTGEPHGKVVHMGATSQDIIDTALMLRLKQAAAILVKYLDRLDGVLRRLTERDGGIRLVAHTRVQQALAFTAADKLESWTSPLQRQAENLSAMNARIFALQLGGAVGSRAAFEGKGDAIAAEMAKNLGLSNAPCWHSQRDRIAEFASWLSLTSGVLGKIGQDIALMAQTEVAEVSLEGGGGSSAMPHKSNPVQAEMLVTLARFNAGSLGTLHQALVHENERSGTAWTLEWMVLPQMVVATAAGLEKAQGLLGGLRFRPSAKIG